MKHVNSYIEIFSEVHVSNLFSQFAFTRKHF